MKGNEHNNHVTRIQPIRYEECDLKRCCYYRLFCAAADKTEMPSIVRFRASELLASNRSGERYLYIMYSGLCMETFTTEEGDESLISLLGASQALNPGAAVRRFDTSTYMHFLVDSEVCRLSLQPIARGLQHDHELGIYVIDALFSTMIGSSALLWIHSGTRCIDRIRRLFFMMAYLLGRYVVDESSRLRLRSLLVDSIREQERFWIELRVSQSTISSITLSSRPQIKSTLRKLGEEGCIEYGYRCVRVDINHILGQDRRNQFPIANIDGLFPLCTLFSEQ